ncbi:MAG: cytochrome c [Calditrichaceae bacterium]
MKILITVVSTLFGLLLIGLIVMYSGFINVSALEPSSGFTRWILHTTMDRSVDVRGEDLPAPDLNNEDMIREGGEHYVHMCQGCHGAPGIEDTEFAKGLEPRAPHLYRRSNPEDFNAGEAFWVTKNGIMMTSMPAWGRTHSDQKIWNIVAFLKKLPQLSPEEYNQIMTQAKSEPMEMEEHSMTEPDMHKEQEN